MRKILLLLLSYISIYYSDKLYLVNGEEYSGEIRQITNEKIFFNAMPHNKMLEINLREILQISFSAYRQFEGTENVNQIKHYAMKYLRKKDSEDIIRSDDNFIYLYWEENYKVINDSIYEREVIKLIKILSPKGGEKAGNQEIIYNSSDEIKLHFALTVTPNGTVINTNDNAITKLTASNYPDNKIRILRFFMPLSSKNNVLFFSYTLKCKYNSAEKPFLISHQFQYTEPIYRKTVTLTLPENYSINQFHSPPITASRKRNKYSWSIEKRKAIVPESQSPPLNYISPELKVSLNENWNSIAIDYMQKLENMLPDSATLRKDFRKRTLSDISTARDLYYDLLIRYSILNISPAEYGFLPRKYEKIRHSRYLLRMDAAFLYYSLLRNSGFTDIDFLLVASRNEVNFREDIHTLAELLYPVVFLRIGEKDYYVYINEIDRHFSQLPGFLMGSKALSIRRKSIISIPDDKPELMDVDMRIELGKPSKGKLKIILSGNIAIQNRNIKRFDEAYKSVLLHDFLSDELSNVQIDSFSIEGNSYKSDQLIISVSFSSPLILRNTEGKILFMKLPLYLLSLSSVLREDRFFPIFYTNKYEQSIRLSIVPPPGYKFLGLPQSFRLTKGVNSFKQDCILDNNGNLIYNDNFKRMSSLIGKKDYHDFRTLLFQTNIRRKQGVFLIKNE
ncbi:MAG: DUF3857 domain-containing protein [Candidatus Coatesbacteria bacterium]|nr:DUF3857 domain-containing protein [Candidatus Coatesbacteria bacterium]